MRGEKRQGKAIVIDVLANAAYCQVGSSNEKGWDNTVAGCTWVPEIVKEKKRETGKILSRQVVIQGHCKEVKEIAYFTRWHCPTVQTTAFPGPLHSAIWLFLTFIIS